MGKLFDLLSSGVGLAAEAVAQNTGKASQQRTTTHESEDVIDVSRYPNSPPPRYEEAQSSKHLEFENDKDIDRQYYQYQYSATRDSYNYSQAYPASVNQTSYESRLPMPVIIPQRRPGTKDRGWAYAYTPALQNCGIDRDAFVDFLCAFNSACQSSPALDAVNIAAFGVGFAPGIAPMVVSAVVPMVVSVAKTAQTNTQSSSFLAKANTELFEPRGLVAVITTFRNEEQSAMVSVNQTSPSGRSEYSKPTNEDIAADQYNAECMLQAAAPLQYIDDAEVMSRLNHNRVHKAGHFVADYMDRRAQAQLSTKTNGIQASYGPKPQFKTVWGDPNSAANNGGLIGLVSGGMISRPRKDKDQKKNKKDKKQRKHRGPYDSSDENYDNGDQKQNSGGLIRTVGGSLLDRTGQGHGSIGGIKDLKKKMGPSNDLLYLMIVNKD